MLLLLSALSADFLSGQYVAITENELTMDNGLIERKIIYDPASGQLVSGLISVPGDGFNYLQSPNASAEFRISVNNKSYDGRSEWTLIGIEKISGNSGGLGAMVKLKSPSNFELHIQYMVYPGLPVTSKSLTIVNTGDENINIENIDIEALTFKAFPTSAEYYINYCRDKHIGPYEGDWDDPVIAMHLPEIGRGVVLGNEAPGVLKRISCYQDARDFCAGLTHADQAYPFMKWIDPGEGYTTPEVFLLIYKDAASPYKALNFVLPQYVRQHMGLEIFKNPYKPQFVYNTWNPFRGDINDTLMRELSDAATECGIREFVIDDGWQLNMYTYKDVESPWWYTQVGDYLIDEKKFPDGLKPVFDHIKSNGMKPGLWLSIGSANTSSQVYREHPEWFVQDVSGNLTNLHSADDTTMKTACMSTAWKEHIMDIILKLEKEHGLTYTKLDFASITSAYITDPAISGCYANDHAGHRDHRESLVANYNGLFRLFDGLQKGAPDLFIDCTFETQGKLHLIDYAFMKHAEGNWLSNIEEASPVGALRVRHLAWQRTPVIPAACMVIGNLRLDSDDLEFDFFSLLGTFPIMLGDIRKVPEENRKWLSRWSDWMEKMQADYDYMSYRQDLRGFGEPAEGKWDGWQRINTETREGGIAGVFRQGSPENTRMVTIEGLIENGDYEVIDADMGSVLGTYSGQELREQGFEVKMNRKYQGRIFEIRGI